jgi:hypothetical protein
MMGYVSLSRTKVQFAIYVQCVAVLPTRNEFAGQLADVLYLEVLTNNHFYGLVAAVYTCTSELVSSTPEFVLAVSVSVV